ncbi:MAG: elongation factor P lysine(34) lysyltransferase [SAR86 cluster bacterium]|uniref:Elongation factor P lysine(34) lysyltransferase n=1 Tax=SAR86 cluster bacterium TaxID=2030880 RepID=A0A2A4WY26_9GAMM|nr:MAG: elongation factor P lysine(34) lysyltransferase [SAR86 cluster bacterium]
MVDWKPSASLKNLQQRARVLAKIRYFFSERDVLEVETPLLASSTVPDVYIESIAAEVLEGNSSRRNFLQTSPEFFMKRLLASGSGSIYQIAKAFRQEEKGTRHNIEFTLLEWYRLSYSLDQLMTEVERLVQEVLDCGPISRFSYREIFQQHLQIDPHEITLDELQQLANTEIDLSSSDLSKTDYLQLLLSSSIEPQLPPFCIIYNYPKEQAALSTLAADEHGVVVAKRFELFGQGMELANGYFELSDAAEQRARFESDNATRKEKGLQIHDADEKLIAALESGLPSCSGVAMGVDRLLMLLVEAKNIGEVISFDSERA